MAQTHQYSLDLQAQLERAIARYRQTWQVVDSEFYDLCRRRPGQRDFAEVYGKVAMIGRIYTAGIARSSRAEGNREAEVACGLIEQADLVEGTLRKLAGQQFDRASAVEIIELHGLVTQGLCSHTGDRWLTSFVSKYLHFHCDIVPVFDSRAAHNIGRFVSRRDLLGTRGSVVKPTDGIRAYYEFVTKFLVLRERLETETSIPATVKEADYLLLQSA